MKYDNDRDRYQYGYDAGNIIDGTVTLDSSTGEYVIVDDEGLAFSTQELLKSLATKKIRLTCISFEAIENVGKMMINSES